MPWWKAEAARRTRFDRLGQNPDRRNRSPRGYATRIRCPQPFAEINGFGWAPGLFLRPRRRIGFATNDPVDVRKHRVDRDRVGFGDSASRGIAGFALPRNHPDIRKNDGSSGVPDDSRRVVPRIATAFESRCRMFLHVAREMSIFRFGDGADLTAKCMKWFLQKASDGPARGNERE